MEQSNILEKYVLRKIKGIYILVNIKENELIEVDKDTFEIIKILKTGVRDIDYISEKVGKDINKIKMMIEELLTEL